MIENSGDDVLNEDYIDRSKLLLVAFISNLGAMLLGFDYGVTSKLLTDIDYFASNDEYSDYTYFSVVENSSILLGFLASGAAIGSAITFAILILYGNSVSKKDELLLAAFLYFIGAMLESFSFYFSWKYSTGLVLLSIGRLTYGAGVATSFHASPQYVAEIAPADVRGNIGSATEVMTACGVLLGYVLGFVSNEEDGWAQIYLIGYVIALVMGCLALFIPHSPKWMARHNFPPNEILESLQFLYPNATDSSVVKLRKECEIERAQSARMDELWKTKYSSNASKNWFQSMISAAAPEVKFLFYDKILSRCLTYGLVLVTLNTATGHSAILYYAGSIFDEVCIDPDACIVGLGFAKLIPALMMTVIADIFGRRVMLMTGIIVVTTGLFIITGGYSNNNDDAVITGMYIAVSG
jgi:MFS family permease